MADHFQELKSLSLENNHHLDTSRPYNPDCQRGLQVLLQTLNLLAPISKGYSVILFFKEIILL